MVCGIFNFGRTTGEIVSISLKSGSFLKCYYFSFVSINSQSPGLTELV